MSAAEARREPLHRRTGSPVRRGSRRVGTELAGFWRPITRRAAHRIEIAARRYDRLRKTKGSRNGPLGYVGLGVLEALLGVVDRASGRLEPSIDWLMARTKLCRGAVVAGLARLRDHGFLSWIRRFEPTGMDGQRGPQVRQVTNAYRVDLPPAAEALVSPAPPVGSDDLEHAREQAAAARREAAATDETTPMGRSLARLARHFGERESG